MVGVPTINNVFNWAQSTSRASFGAPLRGQRLIYVIVNPSCDVCKQWRSRAFSVGDCPPEGPKWGQKCGKFEDKKMMEIWGKMSNVEHLPARVCEAGYVRPYLQAVANDTSVAERPHHQIHLLAPFGKASCGFFPPVISDEVHKLYSIC